MSVLSGEGIMDAIVAGDISIDPFNEKQMNPNSYNLRLARKMLRYDEVVLDCKKDNRVKEIHIPDHGYTLVPGVLYLASTVEKTRTDKYVPLLEGRSSFARLGLTIHISAGFGDIGFNGHWTLEMCVIHPLIIYPCMEICQIFYHTVQGRVSKTYDSGKYQNNDGVQPSRLHFEFGRQNT